jgi:hypothetical protein
MSGGVICNDVTLFLSAKRNIVTIYIPVILKSCSYEYGYDFEQCPQNGVILIGLEIKCC